MPEVSVVIPSYQHGRFIKKAILSTLNQTVGDIEVIITDDASQDNTVEVINSIKDNRIILNVFRENKGAAYAINDAIARSTGDYIAVLNSDDFWDFDKLEKQISYLKTHPECSAVFCLPKFVNEQDEIITNHMWYNLFTNGPLDQVNILRKFFYEGNFLCHPSVLLPRYIYEKIGYYDPRLTQLPDFEMWLRLVSKTSIHILPERLVSFRILDNEQNASAASPDALARDMFEFEMVLRHYSDLPDDLFQKIFDHEIKELRLNNFSRTVALGWLSACVQRQSHQSFGLRLLFEAMRNNHTGIDSKIFRELLTRCDPYRVRFSSDMQKLVEYNLANR